MRHPRALAGSLPPNHLIGMPPSPAQTIRTFIYQRLLDSGFPPSLREIGTFAGLSLTEARAGVANLNVGKTVLVHPTTGEIWMAGPFAAGATPYKVSGKSAQWFANCAWDMLGIPFIAHEEVRIETQCTDCGEPWSFSAGTANPPAAQGIVHFLLPARQWYDDIGFT